MHRTPRRLPLRLAGKLNSFSSLPTSRLVSSPHQTAPAPSQPIFSQIPLIRQFTTTPSLSKKGGKKSKSTDEDSSASDDANNSTTEIFDFEEHFTTLESTITKSLTKLKDDLSKLRATGAGGRNSPASTIEGLHVQLDKASTDTTPLRDLAHVVPKGGRQLTVTVYEVDHVKKVIGAIQKADLNLQPVADAKNPAQLNIPLPPPTKDDRIATAEHAGKIGEGAVNALKMARLASHKKIKGLGKSARPDDVRKADVRLEKIMHKGNEEAKKIVDATKKAILDN